MSARPETPGSRRNKLVLAAVAMLAVAAVAGCATGDGGRPGESASVAAGDAARGRLLYRKCVACHSLEKEGPNKVGPRLHGLFGRTSGDVADYKYSRALKAAGIVWDEATLDVYLADTTGMVPGTKMYAYMSRQRDRADLIAYLRKATGRR